MSKINQTLTDTFSAPRIVALSGTKGAGKDELVHYLVQQYGVPAIDIGEFSRQLAEEAAKKDGSHLRYDVSSRNMAEHGAAYIMQQLVAELTQRGQSTERVLLITGLLTPAEAAVLKENFGDDLLLAFVRVGDQKARYDRLQDRNRETDPNDFQDFVAEDEHLKDDYALNETAALADVILWNNDTLTNYHALIETHLVPHLFPEKGDNKLNGLD